MVSTDNYLAGALTLLYSVRKTGSVEEFVALVTSDGLSRDTSTALSTAGLCVCVCVCVCACVWWRCVCVCVCVHIQTHTQTQA